MMSKLNDRGGGKKDLFLKQHRQKSRAFWKQQRLTARNVKANNFESFESFESFQVFEEHDERHENLSFSSEHGRNLKPRERRSGHVRRKTPCECPLKFFIVDCGGGDFTPCVICFTSSWIGSCQVREQIMRNNTELLGICPRFHQSWMKYWTEKDSEEEQQFGKQEEMKSQQLTTISETDCVFF